MMFIQFAAFLWEVVLAHVWRILAHVSSRRGALDDRADNGVHSARTDQLAGAQPEDHPSSDLDDPDNYTFLFIGRVPVYPFVTVSTKYALQTHPQSEDAGDEQATGNRIEYMTWFPIIHMNPPIVFPINASHVHFTLFQDALQQFRTEFMRNRSDMLSLTFLSATDPESFYHPDESFYRLVNLLADRCCPAIGDPLRFPTDLTSILNYLIAGMMAVVNVKTSSPSHPGICGFLMTMHQVVESDGREPSTSLAAFLDTITAFWQSECQARRQAVWSPMPWSRASTEEAASHRSAGLTLRRRKLLHPGNFHLDDDHWVFRPLGCNWGRIFDIPWLGASHDGYPLLPTLASYTKARRAGKCPTPRDDAALWLSAMTFGLLEILTGVNLSQKQLLTCNTDGHPVLSGSSLSRLLFAWSVRQCSTKMSDSITHLRRGVEIARLMRRALSAQYEVCMVQWSILLRAGIRMEEAEEIICSLGTFLSALCHCVSTTWEEVEDCKALGDVDAMQHAYVGSVALVCRKRLLSAGWCPYTVSFAFLQVAPIPVLSNIVRLKPYTRGTIDEHRNCTMSACKFYTFDGGSYKQRHVHPSCGCPNAIPPLSDVIDLLSEGIVPVIAFEQGRISVRSAVEGPYVAISHVWADGLGSTTEEGVPTCQVARIAGLVKEILPESGAFWMDSLCIPAVKDHRKSAIKHMAQTYEGAHTVLVLDVGIRSSCARTRPWEENVLRIATSGWVTRVWTLQEGILAPRLCFEFADGLMDARTLESFDGDPAQQMAQQFSRGLLPLLAFRARRLRSPTTRCTLRDIIMLVRRRTTSKPEDETIAIAGLLPINVSTLLSITGDDAPERRMKEFILQMREVPRRWPLLPQEKLRIPGFTWVPRSLADARESDDTDGDGTCTEDGLLAQYTVARFHTPLPLQPPARNPSMDSEDFHAMIVHQATSTSCLVTIHSNLPPIAFNRPAYANALLLTVTSLPDTAGSPTFGALVHRREGQGEMSGRRETEPLVFDYLASVELNTFTTDLAHTFPGRVVDVELAETYVRLV